MSRILICTPKVTVRRRLVVALRKSTVFYGVREVTGVETVLALLQRTPVSVLLIDSDVAPPSLVRQLLDSHPDVAIMVLASRAQGPNAAIELLSSGARGVVWPASFDRPDWAAVGSAAAGDALLEPLRLELTARELEVLIGISEGKSNVEIGLELDVTTHAVKSCTHSLYAKLRVADRAAAVAVGFRHGMLL